MKKDRKTEMLLTVYAFSEAKKLLATKSDSNEPSEEFATSMREMIEKADKRRLHHGVKKWIKTAASIVVLFSVAFGIFVIPVKAHREYFFNLFNHSFTISSQNNADSSQLFTDANIYIPTWIPKGYVMTNYNIDDVNTIITFTSQEGRAFIFCQKRASDKNLYDSEVKDLTKLSGKDGEIYFYGKKAISGNINSVLIWSNGLLEFSLNATLDENELLHIAQSIKQN